MNACAVLEAIWHTCEMTDVIFICYDGTVKSHKAILAAASPCLKEAMLGMGDDQGEEVCICLPDSSVQDVISVLSLIYLGSSFVPTECQISVMETASALGLNLSWNWWDENFPYDPCASTFDLNQLPPLSDNLFTAEAAGVGTLVETQPVVPEVSQIVPLAESVLKPSQHACGACGKTFKTSAKLERHVQTHTNGKESAKSSTTCEVCDKLFKSAALLERHVRTHTGARPFVCDQCGMTFVRSHHLADHRKRHANAKPFGCSECGKPFARRTTLEVHMRTRHAKSRAFRCDLCDKTFGRNDVLKRHKLLKHKVASVSEKPVSLPSPGPSGVADPFTYFEDISVSSVMTSYENWETDFVLTADPSLDFLKQ